MKFQIPDVLKLTVRELDILRTVGELSSLNSQIRLKFPLSVLGILVLPETFLIDSLNAYIDMTTLPTVFEARQPAFWSVPPSFSREELYLKDETPFECWLYVNSWQHPHQNRVADAVVKSMFIGVNPKEDIFVAGHSLGATCANYLVTYQQYQYAGLMLFGGYVVA